MTAPASASVAGVLDPTVRDRVRRNRAVLVVGAVVVVVSALLAWAAAGTRTGYLDPDSADPSGARALAQLLRDQEVDVVVVRRADEVAAAVDAGGEGTTLVVAGPAPVSAAVARVLARADADDVVLVDPTPDALAVLARGVEPSFGAGEQALLEPGCDDAAAARAGRLLVRTGITFSAAGATTCYSPAVVDEAGRPGEGGVLARLDADGSRPPTTLLGDGSVLANETLADEGNAALGLNVLGRDSTVVWWLPSLADPLQFDDGTEGVAITDLVPSWVGIAVAQVFAAVLFTVWWRGRRLGRVVVEPLPVTVRATEAVEGRARLYRRAGDRGRAADVLRAATVARISSLLRLPRTADLSEVVPAVVARTGRDATAVAALLTPGAAPTDDASLSRLADALDTLEDEVRRS